MQHSWHLVQSLVRAHSQSNQLWKPEEKQSLWGAADTQPSHAWQRFLGRLCNNLAHRSGAPWS